MNKALTKKHSTVKGVGEKDCLLVFKPNDDVELHVPEMPPDAIVPPYMELATIVMVLMTTGDKDFYKLINKKQKAIRLEYTKMLS